MEIAVASGHSGEVELPGTFVAYELNPREYEFNTAQTVLWVHTRVADLYDKPMNQTEQQLRLTSEALRGGQEHELINNGEFGLPHNAYTDPIDSTERAMTPPRHDGANPRAATVRRAGGPRWRW